MKQELPQKSRPRHSDKRFSPAALYVLLVVLLTFQGWTSQVASGQAPDDGGPVVSPETPQGIRGDVFEDYHYAFTLTRPSDSWQFLQEQRANRIHADAVLAMTNSAQHSFVAMIVEKLDNATLDAYVDLILSNFDELNARELERLSIDRDGRPGVVITLEATVEGIDFTYRNLLIKNGHFFYQILGWSLSQYYPIAEAEIRAVGESLVFADDREPQVRAGLGAEDDYGVDWIIRDNIYSNVSFGFRLRPQHDFRLTERQELQQMGPEASAGIVSSNPTFYQLYLVEFVGDQNKEEYAENVLLWLEQEFNLLGVNAKKSSVSVAGIEAEQWIYENADLGGLAFDVAQTLFFRDAYLYRIQSWWLSSEADTAQARLLQSYELMEWLDEEERADLLAGFTELDANNAVGSEYSLRNNVFRDFQYGFTLTLPPGLWQVATGDAAHLISSDARLIASLTTDGVQFLVIPELLTMGHEEYHQILRENLSVSADVPIDTLRHQDLDLLLSAFSEWEGGFNISYRLVTAVRGRKHLQLLVWAHESSQENLDQWLPRIIEGLSVPVSSPQIIERQGRTIKDHRLGFQMTYADGWGHTVEPIGGLEAVSNMINLSSEETSCSAMAVFVPGRLDEDRIIEAMMSNALFGIDPSTRREEASTLAGLPARQIAFESQEGSFSFRAWIVRRGNTAYFLMVNGPAGGFVPLETYKSFFALLD